jgi:uncharacterized membrane protein YfcA
VDDWLQFASLFSVGLFAGVLNVTAGGGSFLTLPLLIFLGYPPIEANGTNRVGIFLQNLGAVWSFNRQGLVDLNWMRWAMGPGLLGCLFGTWLALVVNDDTFQKTLALLIVGVTIWTLWDPVRKPWSNESLSPGVYVLVMTLGFFVIGLYAGFVQAGVGFFILALATLVGLDLVRGNSLKVLSVLVFTCLALSLFAWYGKVHWVVGLSLGAGTMVGGLMGVKLTIVQGHSWLKKFVTITMIGFAIKLWIDV